MPVVAQLALQMTFVWVPLPLLTCMLPGCMDEARVTDRVMEGSWVNWRARARVCVCVTVCVCVRVCFKKTCTGLNEISVDWLTS